MPKRTKTRLIPSLLESPEYFILNHAPVSILVVDRESCIQLVNDQAEKEFGYSRDQLVGKPITVLVPEEHRETHTIQHEKYLEDPVPRMMGSHLSLTALRANGEKIPVDIGLSPVETETGVQVIVYIANISELRRGEEALRQVNDQLVRSLEDLEFHNRELTLLSEMSEILQTCESVDEAYLVIADFAQRMFPEQSGGLFLHSKERKLVEAASTWGDIPPEQQTFLPNSCWAIRRGRPHIVDKDRPGVRCQHTIKDDEPDQQYQICIPMQALTEVLGIFHLRGDADRSIDILKRMAVSFADQIALAISNIILRETLRNQSIRDPLTSLYNRRFMEETLAREITLANRYHLPLSVILLDIDKFKDFNDTYGHLTGDILLQKIGAFLSQNIRSVDYACRYGGEEFLVILPDTNLENSLKVARKLMKGINQLKVEQEDQVIGHIQVSIGVAAFQGDLQTNKDLLQEADQALYRAKQQGRNRIIKA